MKMIKKITSTFDAVSCTKLMTCSFKRVFLVYTWFSKVHHCCPCCSDDCTRSTARYCRTGIDSTLPVGCYKELEKKLCIYVPITIFLQSLFDILRLIHIFFYVINMRQSTSLNPKLTQLIHWYLSRCGNCYFTWSWRQQLICTWQTHLT